MDNKVRWTVKVSREADICVRSYLARQGLKKGDLSKFIEAAVIDRVRAEVLAETKKKLSGASPSVIEAEVRRAIAAIPYLAGPEEAS
jgi:Ribbon-helix-helix domain